jgi:hypothetical protein
MLAHLSSHSMLLACSLVCACLECLSHGRQLYFTVVLCRLYHYTGMIVSLYRCGDDVFDNTISFPCGPPVLSDRNVRNHSLKLACEKSLRTSRLVLGAMLLCLGIDTEVEVELKVDLPIAQLYAAPLSLSRGCHIEGKGLRPSLVLVCVPPTTCTSFSPPRVSSRTLKFNCAGTWASSYFQVEVRTNSSYQTFAVSQLRRGQKPTSLGF